MPTVLGMGPSWTLVHSKGKVFVYLTGKPELVTRVISVPLQPESRMELKPLPVSEDGFLPSTVSCWVATLAFGSTQPTQ